jgi:hypothetical protein
MYSGRPVFQATSLPTTVQKLREKLAILTQTAAIWGRKMSMTLGFKKKRQFFSPKNSE